MVTRDHYLCEPLLDATSLSTRETLESAAGMFSRSNFVWEEDCKLGLENFQDLSEYCESTAESESIKLQTAESGNMSVLQDDELNTPEIGCQEPFFGDSTRLIQFPLEVGEGWPVGVNSRPGTFDLSIADVTQEHQFDFDVVSPTNSAVNLYSPTEQRKSDLEAVISSHVNCEDFNIVVEHEETVEMLPSEERVDTCNSDVVKHEPSNVEPSNVDLYLTLSSESAKLVDLPSTPDVIQQLYNPHTFLDLIKIIEDDGSPEVVQPTTDFSAVQFNPSESAILDETEAAEQPSALETRLPLTEQHNKLESSLAGKSFHRDNSTERGVEESSCSEPSTSYSVVSEQNSSGSPLRITIKRESETSRRSSRSKRRTSYADFMKEEEDDSDEVALPSPSKRRKRSTPSCSTDGDLPCARYRQLRDRNNEASRRSRQTRKAREEEMKIQSEELEQENQKLKVKCEELERQLSTCRQLLVDILSTRKSGQ